MAKKSLAEDVLDIVSSICFHLPAWAIPLVAIVPTLFVHIFFSILAEPLNRFGPSTFQGVHGFALLVTFALSSFAGFVGWGRRQRRKGLLKDTDSLERLRSLHWQEFEELVAESYRAKGFRASETGGSKADGGIDIDMTSPSGQRVLVQCKHWRTSKVGVKIVREMLGVLAKEKANLGVIVVTGDYTQEAKRFAEGQPIELIDGNALLAKVSGTELRTNSPTLPETASPESQIDRRKPIDDETLPPCPRCGAPLVTRFAKRGSNAGGSFIGCSAFPKCRYTKN